MTSRRIMRAALAAAALAMAVPAAAATYTVNVGNPLDLGTVIAAAAGDTVFKIDPATGSVTVLSGGGRRVSTDSVRALVTVTCKPARTPETTCKDTNLKIQLGTVGLVTGRARALTSFTVSMGTATLVGAPTGTNPVSFQLAPLGDNTPKTFYLGASFPVAGDDSGLPTGAGENSFYAQILDNLGVPYATDTDKGKLKALRALSLAKTSDLAFGQIKVPSSGTSTVTLNPSTGVRTVTGNGAGFPAPAPTRAAFTVTGEGGQQVSINIPSTINLTGPGTLPVAITSTAATAPSLPGPPGSAGTYGFNIGGSFTITPTTPTGAYAGILTVSVDYN